MDEKDKIIRDARTRIRLANHFKVSPNEIATTPPQINKFTKIWCGDIVGYDKERNILPEYTGFVPALISRGIQIFVSPKKKVEIIEVISTGKKSYNLLESIRCGGGTWLDDVGKIILNKDEYCTEFQITPMGKTLKIVFLEAEMLKLNSKEKKKEYVIEGIWRMSEKMGLKNCPHDIIPNILSSKELVAHLKKEKKRKSLFFKTCPLINESVYYGKLDLLGIVFSGSTPCFYLPAFIGWQDPDWFYGSRCEFAFLI